MWSLLRSPPLVPRPPWPPLPRKLSNFQIITAGCLRLIVLRLLSVSSEAHLERYYGATDMSQTMSSQHNFQPFVPMPTWNQMATPHEHKNTQLLPLKLHFPWVRRYQNQYSIPKTPTWSLHNAVKGLIPHFNLEIAPVPHAPCLGCSILNINLLGTPTSPLQLTYAWSHPILSTPNYSESERSVYSLSHSSVIGSGRGSVKYRFFPRPLTWTSTICLHCG